MQVMDWNDLRYVPAVSREGTLAAAARRMRVDQTTVARRLAEAERGLGARLFERIDGGLRPTRAGEAAIAQAAGAGRGRRRLVGGPLEGTADLAPLESAFLSS